jgi:hypothetical protein
MACCIGMSITTYGTAANNAPKIDKQTMKSTSRASGDF